MPQKRTPSTDEPGRTRLRDFPGVFRYSGRALELVWSTSRRLTVLLAALTLMGGLLPAAVAYAGKLIVDAVVAAAASGSADDRWLAVQYVGLEAGLVVAMTAVQRGLSVVQSLLRALLGQRVNVLILEKSVTLELAQFEDPDFYDKMTRARREASTRPLGLVTKTFGLLQNAVSIVTYGGLLLHFSGWAVLVLAVAAVPAFLVETRYSGEAFRLFRWRAPETRKRAYLEMVLAREDFTKEVKIFGLGPLLLDRYRAIFDMLYDEDRDLTLRRGLWGFLLGLLSTAAFYGAYVWIAVETVAGHLTLGEMTMYVLVFKQGQSAFAAILAAIGGMYEDNLYLSNLYEFLEQRGRIVSGTETAGPLPGDGLRFVDVSFTYPDADRPAVDAVSFHIEPGQKLALVGENGSGKTTLIKLLTRLYDPDGGRILLDGLDLKAWDRDTLRRRVGVIFQDFNRYQFLVGENIGAGDVDAFDDESRWHEAADKGMAAPFIEQFPEGYRTQLGRWFKDGRELSIGQWQKVALSRAFMRRDADILVLDEPTAAMDAEAEMQVFEHFREKLEASPGTRDGGRAQPDEIAERSSKEAVAEPTGPGFRPRMTIVISHRFSTVRMADHILVLHDGQLVEQGTHEALMAREGRYARLFSLQAEGYR